MDSLKPTDQIEIEIPHFRHPDFKPWAAVVVSFVSLIVSFASLAKTPDDSQVKMVYEAQSKAIKDLSREIQDLNQDLAILRGYSEGQSKALTVAVPVKPGESTAPAESFSVQIPLKLVPFKDVKPDEWTAPVPALRPPPKEVALPAYDELKIIPEK